MNSNMSNLILLNGLNASNASFSTYMSLDGATLHDFYRFLRESEWRCRVVPITIFVSVLMVFGAVGNSLVITVFMRSSSPLASSSSRMGGSRSKPLIVSLAVADLLLCTVAMPGQIVRAWYLPWYWDALCKMWELLRHAVLPVSAAILVAIAYDRYCLICHPTRHYWHRWYKRNMRVTLGGACLVGLAFGIPPMLAVGVYQAADGHFPSQVTYLGLCEVNGLIVSQYALWIYWRVLVAFFCLVLVSLLIIYSAILTSVWQQAKQWNRRTCSTRVCPIKLPTNITQLPASKANTTSKLTVKPDSASKYSESDESSKKDWHRGGSCKSDFQEANKQPESNPDNCNMDNNNLFFIKVADLARRQPRDSSLFVKRTETLELVLERPRKCSDSDMDAETALQSCSSSFADNTTSSPLTPLQLQQRFKFDHVNLERLELIDAQRKKLRSKSLTKSNTTNSKTNATNVPGVGRGHSAHFAVTVSSLRPPGISVKPQPRRPPCPAHVKTAMVFILVTVTFLLSYIPTFLMIIDLVPDQPVLFYAYFIHAAANPLLYSLTNKKFRTSAKELFTCGT